MTFRLFQKVIACSLLVSLFGAGCTKAPDVATVNASKPIALQVWGVGEDIDAYSQVNADYRGLHPNVNIQFRRFRLEEYEQQLLNAFAEDRGPDMFLIHNDWLGKYMTKIVPMPATTNVAYSVITGTLNKQATWIMQADPSITLKDYKDSFADVCLQDTIRTVNVAKEDEAPSMKPSIMGLPVYIDTMAMYYNKDLLNAANIAGPADNWTDFQDQVKSLTQVSSNSDILQSGAAMGTGNNVDRAQDLLTVLMMQNGAQMASDDGAPTFNIIPQNLQGKVSLPPSFQALEFYTDFANPTKETYTWNASMPNSLDAFIQGRVAYFFGYAYHLPMINARAPKLNLGIAKMPQIPNNPVRNIANYWFWVVSKKSKNQDVAWNLMNFMVKPEESKKILDFTKKPAARKSMIKDQLNDESVGVFASQVLSAKSWYRGKDPAVVSQAFTQMMASVLDGTLRTDQAVNDAASRVSQSYQ